jgi:hypothetical protein
MVVAVAVVAVVAVAAAAAVALVLTAQQGQMLARLSWMRRWLLRWRATQTFARSWDLTNLLSGWRGTQGWASRAVLAVEQTQRPLRSTALAARRQSCGRILLAPQFRVYSFPLPYSTG